MLFLEESLEIETSRENYKFLVAYCKKLSPYNCCFGDKKCKCKRCLPVVPPT